MPIAAIVGAREAVQREQDLLAAGERRRLAGRVGGEIERREGGARRLRRRIDRDLVGNRAGEAGERRLRVRSDEERRARRESPQPLAQRGAAAGESSALR